MIRSPVNAARRKATRSRVREYGASKGMSFHRRTMTSEEAPMPRANRPGAAQASAAADCARVAGPRVNEDTTAVPSRSRGSVAAASASGVKPSAPFDSADHTSV
ncbi:hypothetical protein SVIO_095710 [Streptomyces violaceusniger]|uniref:Uncharacterized protein n=1 Tax=Streptomyces violaceusniger TaxID=68280 RepID=A0A4D4LKI7_STRVO|nr:hypothetical protein SVIO_095710 [Streptomyces violaceusniger]